MRIDESRLSSFLSTARSLEIRGLMGEDEESQRKRRRNHSVESSDESSRDVCVPPAPPPPPPLKHKTSLTKNLEVKKEFNQIENEVIPYLQHSDSESLKSSCITATELDANGLALFQCSEDPGPSRTSEDEINQSGHGEQFLFSFCFPGASNNPQKSIQWTRVDEYRV